MITHADSQLFWNDTVHKDWQIEIVEDGVTLTNEDLLVDQLTIQETLCSDQDIALGSCVASSLEFEMFNKGRKMKGKKLRVSLVLDGHYNNPIPIGVYKVEDDTLAENERIRKIKAYDALYTILEKDFAAWFNEDLPNPTAITVKQLRDSFMEYAEIEQEDVNLINDSTILTFTIANSAATERMIKEENERIQQMIKDAENGVVLYEYREINLSKYDKNKKDKKVVYTEVETVLPDDDPVENVWYVYDKKGYRKARKHTVKNVFTNIQEVEVHDGDNPAALHYCEATGRTTDPIVKYTEDTTVTPGKQYYTADYGPIKYYTRSETKYFNPYKLGWYIKPDPAKEEYVLATKDYQFVDPSDPGQTPFYEKVEYTIATPSYKEVVDVKETDDPKARNWYYYNGSSKTPTKADETSPQPNRTYYEQCLPENRGSAMLLLNLNNHPPAQNPKDSGWYEKDDERDAFVKTKDETIDPNKNYYVNIWEVDQNDQKDVIYDEIKGADIINAICEINGVFGHINREGKFSYISLKAIDPDDVGLYPDPELYPDPSLYPAGDPADWIIDRSKFETCEKESYVVQKLDRLVICKEDGDNGYVYPADSRPEGHNTYKITGNFIWYSFTDKKDTLNIVGNNILSHGIASISEYTPCEIDMMGNPCIEVGDSLKVITRLGTFYTYVLERTLTGSQRLKDSIKAKGNEKRQSDKSIYDAVIEMKGRSNILTRNVDSTRNEIIDMGEHMSSLIEQTAEAIKFEVSKEVKNVEDNTQDKYQSAIKYTDDQISMTVSRTMYDADMEELQTWQSGIQINYNKISAEVSSTVKATGEGVGFKWDLTTDGWVLSAKGEYVEVTDNPATNLTEVTNTTGKNPYQEEWHEKDSSGLPFLTSDPTPVAGKTYWRSVKVPKDEHWWQWNYDQQTYEISRDDNMKTSRLYYTKRGTPDWDPVFKVNPEGAWMKGYLTTQNLNVRNVATISMLNAQHARIDELDVKYLGVDEIVQRINADYVSSNNIRAKLLEAGGVRASDIRSGLIQASQINTDQLFSDSWMAAHSIRVQALTSDGVISTPILNIKNTRQGVVMNVRDASDGDYHDLKMVQLTVKDSSGSNQTIHFLGWR